MVLDHVTGRADAVVVPRASTEADVLGHRDLNVVDVVRVPDRIEQLIREAQSQNVLDGFLTEVVVDTEDRVLGEHLVDDGVQFASALEVVAERLLDDNSSPLTVLGLREARRRQLLEHLRKRVGRNRKVETVIAADTTFVVERGQRVGQVLEGLGLVETALHEPDTFSEPLPDVLTELGASTVLDCFEDDVREVLVRPVTPGEPDQSESGRQQSTVGEVVDGGHELAPGKVAGNTENHQGAGPRNVRKPFVGAVPKGIHPI